MIGETEEMKQIRREACGGELVKGWDDTAVVHLVFGWNRASTKLRRWFLESINDDIQQIQPERGNE